MTFAYPLVFALLPLILFLHLRSRKRLVVTPIPIVSSSITASLPRSFRLRLRAPVLFILSMASLVSLTVAAARPQLIASIENAQDARNVILALDLSRSMETPDFNIDGRRSTRLDGVKSVVDSFLNQRSGDRIGLIVFGVQSFVQAPLTMDHALIRQMVGSLRCGVAGDGTAIGDGLGLSVKRLQKKSAGTRAIVLITDGVNNSGNVNPLKAAQVARDLNIKVHTIGIGTTETIPKHLLGNFIQTPGSSTAEFDEKLLREIADLTGGKYSAAGSAQDLREIYDEIERLDRAEEDSPPARRIDELFPRFALLSLASYLLFLLLGRSIFVKVPAL